MLASDGCWGWWSAVFAYIVVSVVSLSARLGPWLACGRHEEPGENPDDEHLLAAPTLAVGSCRHAVEGGRRTLVVVLGHSHNLTQTVLDIIEESKRDRTALPSEVHEQGMRSEHHGVGGHQTSPLWASFREQAPRGRMVRIFGNEMGEPAGGV